MKDEQLKMNIDEEIAAELMGDSSADDSSADGQTSDGQTANEIKEEAKHASRKPFVLHDFDPPRDRELAVFTCAKKLSEYIFIITEKSPKKFRWSIITRLQNSSVDVIENLYHANFERGETRLEYQRKAQVALNLVSFYVETALAKNAVSMHQTAVAAKQIAECEKLLNGWIKSTKAGMTSGGNH